MSWKRPVKTGWLAGGPRRQVVNYHSRRNIHSIEAWPLSLSMLLLLRFLLLQPPIPMLQTWILQTCFSNSNCHRQNVFDEQWGRAGIGRPVFLQTRPFVFTKHLYLSIYRICVGIGVKPFIGPEQSMRGANRRTG